MCSCAVLTPLIMIYVSLSGLSRTVNCNKLNCVIKSDSYYLTVLKLNKDFISNLHCYNLLSFFFLYTPLYLLFVCSRERESRERESRERESREREFSRAWIQDVSPASRVPFYGYPLFIYTSILSFLLFNVQNKQNVQRSTIHKILNYFKSE